MRSRRDRSTGVTPGGSFAAPTAGAAVASAMKDVAKAGYRVARVEVEGACPVSTFHRRPTRRRFLSNRTLIERLG